MLLAKACMIAVPEGEGVAVGLKVGLRVEEDGLGTGVLLGLDGRVWVGTGVGKAIGDGVAEEIGVLLGTGVEMGEGEDPDDNDSYQDQR